MKQTEILEKFKQHLVDTEYKVYKDSIKCLENYAIINYQSKSIVDFNIPDDNMIYGIGILMCRMFDGKIFEIHCHSNIDEQIISCLLKKDLLDK